MLNLPQIPQILFKCPKFFIVSPSVMPLFVFNFKVWVPKMMVICQCYKL